MENENPVPQEQPEEKKKSKSYWLIRNIFSGVFGFVKRNFILSILLFIALAFICFYFRGTLHPAIIFVRKYTLLSLLLLFITYLFLQRIINGKWLSKILSFIIYAGLVALLWFYGPGIYEYIGLYSHYNSLNKVELPKMPYTDNERIQPINSIRTLIKQEAISETERATDPNFIRRKDGTYDFSMAVGPSPGYVMQQASKNMYRILSVSATAPAPDFSSKNRHDVNFDTGEFLLFSKHLQTAVLRGLNFLNYVTCEPSEARYLENDKGEWIQVISLTKWKGWLIPRPIFGGVIVIEQKGQSDGHFKRVFAGKGEFISADDVRSYKYLKGQNVIPEEVATFTANSFRFQEGFFAPMPYYHEGDIRIPKLEADQNSMPFVTYFDFAHVGGIESKLYNYFGLEPYGDEKHGLNTSLFIPADGELTVYYIDHAKNEDSYIGTSAIDSKIIESRKNYDWSKNHPAEFRPYIDNIGGQDRFFWLSTVVTKTTDDGTGFIGGTIPEVTITDARYGQVVWIDRTDLAKQHKWDLIIGKELMSYWGLNESEIEGEGLKELEHELGESINEYEEAYGKDKYLKEEEFERIEDEVAREHLVEVFNSFYRKPSDAFYSVIEPISDNGDRTVFSGWSDEVEVTIVKAPFNEEENKVEFIKSPNGGNITHINGKRAMGVDGGIPKYEYSSIDINFIGQQISFPREAFEELYNPANCYYEKVELSCSTKVILEHKLLNYLYIISRNSDGAGGYTVCWIIKDGEYYDRVLVDGF